MPTTTPKLNPTREQFGNYSEAYDYFNRTLFGGTLPRCILNFSRKARSSGFFSAERWASEAGTSHEISLNPDMLLQPFVETMQTLVHEMVHLQVKELGEAGRTGYHNKAWGDRMEAVGLMPSSTGQPGGKETGQKMSDYVIEGGPFEKAFASMPAKCRLPWLSAGAGAKPTKPRNDKTKYSCEGCGANAWGKADLSLICGDCQVPMVAAG